MYQLILFGNVLLDSSYCISSNKDILLKYGLKANDLGECPMDKLMAIQKDAREKCQFLGQQTGGSALNTATVLSSLDVASHIFCGAIGADHTGAEVQRLLARIHLKTCLQLVNDRPTGAGFCLISDDDRCCYADIGASICFNEEFLQANLRNLIDADATTEQIFYIEGFFITGDRFAICQHIADKVCVHPKLLAVNLSAVYLIKAYPLEIKHLAERSSIVFGNYEEFAQMASVLGEASAEDAMRYFVTRSQDDKIVVCTNGGGGVLFCQQKAGDVRCGEIECEAVPADRIVDSTGCGDSFVAGFFHAFLGKQTLEDCIRAGIRVAARTIQVVGVSGTQNNE